MITFTSAVTRDAIGQGLREARALLDALTPSKMEKLLEDTPIAAATYLMCKETPHGEAVTTIDFTEDGALVITVHESTR